MTSKTIVSDPYIISYDDNGICGFCHHAYDRNGITYNDYQHNVSAFYCNLCDKEVILCCKSNCHDSNVNTCEETLNKKQLMEFIEKYHIVKDEGLIKFLKGTGDEDDFIKAYPLHIQHVISNNDYEILDKSKTSDFRKILQEDKYSENCYVLGETRNSTYHERNIVVSGTCVKCNIKQCGKIWGD